jgi:isocitrate dehydrogenase kinase/phosphatase
MLTEMICTIPEHIGWIIVGVAGMLTSILVIQTVRMIYKAIKDRFECWKEEQEEEGA